MKHARNPAQSSHDHPALHGGIHLDTCSAAAGGWLGRRDDLEGSRRRGKTPVFLPGKESKKGVGLRRKEGTTTKKFD